MFHRGPWENATKNKGFCDSILYYWISLGTEHRILHEEADYPVIRTDAAQVYKVNRTEDMGSSVERMAGGNQSTRSFILPVEWRPCPLITISMDPSTRPIFDDDEIGVKGTTWSLERSQDRCGTLDPLQAPS